MASANARSGFAGFLPMALSYSFWASSNRPLATSAAPCFRISVSPWATCGASMPGSRTNTKQNSIDGNILLCFRDEPVAESRLPLASDLSSRSGDEFGDMFLRLVVLSVMCAVFVLAAGRSTPASIQFEEIADRAGLRFITENSPTPNKNQIETMVAGIALLDYDADGYPD